MTMVRTAIGVTPYAVTVTAGRHTLVADEPASRGGADAGAALARSRAEPAQGGRAHHHPALRPHRGGSDAGTACSLRRHRRADAGHADAEERQRDPHRVPL